MRVRLVLLFYLATVLSAPIGAARAGGTNPVPGFIAELQEAVRNDDSVWLKDHLNLPVNYYGAKHLVIRDKATFLKRYAEIMGPELKAKVLAQDPEKYFKNYQGVMLGDGGRNIWIDDFSEGGDGSPPRYEIITINNTP